MKMTINIDNPDIYLSSGKISNVFKSLALKDIKFEELRFKSECLTINIYNMFNENIIMKMAEKPVKDFFIKRKDEFDYNYNQLCIKNMLFKNQINNEQFYIEFEKAKEEVLKNKDILNKLEKLKKLRRVND